MAPRQVTFKGDVAGPECEGLLDLAESLRLGAELKADAGRCWLNALRAVTPDGPFRYVEGFGVTSLGIPFEHGWLLRSEKDTPPVLIDPTLYCFSLAGFAIPTRYVPAFVWDPEKCLAQAVEQKHLPLAGKHKKTSLDCQEKVNGVWYDALARCFPKRDKVIY